MLSVLIKQYEFWITISDESGNTVFREYIRLFEEYGPYSAIRRRHEYKDGDSQYWPVLTEALFGIQQDPNPVCETYMMIGNMPFDILDELLRAVWEKSATDEDFDSFRGYVSDVRLTLEQAKRAMGDRYEALMQYIRQETETKGESNVTA